MNKRTIDYRDFAGAIIKTLKQGILLTTKAGDKINSMTIGWGTLGVIWEKPIFVAYVRDCRYTYEMLQQNPEFTVNIPVGNCDKKALGLLGSKSGRDMDKIAAAGLTPVAPEVISVPGLKEFPLTLECKVLYAQRQEDQKLPAELRDRFYRIQPNDHFCFYGEIVASYVIEP
jgi:flavin reductase (DIM6/NTAB) family NADH-FMN oxidoreductase RutF